ncbi:hypothetical protein [Streptomyces tropicalis]|uniref:Integral membrane protein n=1 Tax=Streptomyces tropicalis TaxID=3034234 RepID=A0ABT6AHB2_9ACTN|nr:hypothetical protein [Streptomyces tropicalis]MDF3303245.1 hypothetical protein [Streptomyces tropicalis]
MSESNDTLAALLIFAAFLHILTLLGMCLHTALAADQPNNDPAQQRPLTALLLGRSPVQRTGRSTFISRLLAVAGLLLTATSVLSVATEAAPAWTILLAVLAATELASAYAWHKPAGVSTTNGAEKPDEDPEQATDSDNEEATKTKDPGSS